MEKIHASLILEILGRPRENVTSALNTILEKMEKEKGVNVLNKKAHEPKPVEKTDLFTSFAEVDVELDSIMSYILLVFSYMPANIEITNPEKLTLNNGELNEIGNALVQRLHHYDAVTKNTLAERDMYAKKLREIAPHLFKKSENQKGEEKPEKKKKSSKKKKSG